MRIKRYIIMLLMAFSLTGIFAQTGKGPFKAHIYNSEYQVFMHINFYDQDIVIPGQELFGQMAGYLSKEGTSYCWLVVSAKIKDQAPGSKAPASATLQFSNDYGSEDLEAELTVEGDSLYVLKQLKGSVLKVPNKGKWQKLPHTLTFKRKSN